MIKKLIFLSLLASLWGATSYGQATNVFVTQSGAGTANGTSLGNAFPITALSSGANCGTGGTQIGADTVVHISVNSSGSSATQTYGTNATMFSFQCSGTTGHPVTLQFKSGDVWQASYFSASAAIQVTNLSNIVIDLNGVLIQDTLNGHTNSASQPAANCPAGPCQFHNDSVIIQALNMNTVEIKGPGTLANTYVTEQCELQGPGTEPCGVSGSASQNAIQYGGKHIHVHHLTEHDNTWANLQTSQIGDDDFEFDHLDISRFDHGIAFGAAPGVNITTFKMHDIHFHDMQNFDTGIGDDNHHDGIHGFSVGHAGKIQNTYIYNNLFDGLEGLCCVTAQIFLEGGSDAWTDTTGQAFIFNNVIIGSIDSNNGVLSVNAGSNHKIYNNYIANTGSETSGGKCFNARGANGPEIINFQNNVIQGCAQALSMDGSVSLGTWNNNGYANLTGQGNEIFNWSGHTNGNVNSLAGWQAICNCDSVSKGGTANNLLGVNSSGVPQTGSILIGNGANLSSFATGNLITLQNDTTAGNTRASTPRPGGTTGWTIGAYNASGAPSPGLTMAPDPAAFGSVNVGSPSSPITVTVTSNGSTTATLGSPVVNFSDPTFSNVGTGTCVINQSLPVGSNCTIIIRFTPTAAGAKSGTMLVGANTSASINLSGTGINATVSIAPNPVAFGSVTQGTTSSPLTVTVSNTGGATLTLATPFFVISGTNAADFARTGGTCSNGGTVAPAASCTLTMTFHPTTTAAESGILTINGNATGTANLSGVGVSPTTPIVSVTPNPVSFGNQVQSTTSSAQTVTVTNTGSANLVLATPFFTFTGANPTNFARAAGTCSDGGTVTPSGTCTITVTFTPNILGARAATLNILGNANGSTSLTGTGIAPATPVVSITPSPVAFGTVQNGTTSSPLTVTVTNSGSATLTLNTPFFTITGTNASEYARTGGTCADGGTVAVSGTCTLTMTFSPAATGSRTATLNIAGNASGTAPLTGTGFPVSTTSMSIAPTPFDFGNVPQHTASATQNFTVTNTGTTTLTFPSTITTFGGSFAADWQFTAGTCISGNTLAPGATCFKTVRGTPSTVGLETGTVTISATTTSATATIRMTGTGTSSIQVTPAPVSFPDTTVGTTSAALTATVKNTGSTSVTLSTPFSTITGTNAGDFTKTGGTCSNGLSLAAGVTCTVTLTFTPTITGSENGLLTVNSATASGSSALQGTGILPTPVPGIALSPSGGVSFGSQVVGTTSSVQTVTVSSTGTSPLVLNTPYFTITGTNSADVTNTGAGSCSNGASLAPGSTCTITLTFNPAGAGARAATLNVGGNASGSLALSGTGIAAVVTLTSAPNPVAFGSVTQSTPSAVQTVTITNTGNVSATLQTPYFTVTGTNSADFANAGTGTCANGGSLAAAGTCTVKLIFTPSLVGAETATLTVSTTGAVTTTDVLGGTGVAPAVPSISIAPDPAAFGNQNVGSTSGGTTITITNSGTATLILAVPFFTISGTNAADFSRSGGTCINGGTVATSTSCTIIIAFSPAAAGSRTATLNISGNASKSSSLTGTGVATAAILTLTPNPMNYGVVIQGSSSITTMTLTNTGTASTTLSSPFFSITGANALDFTRLGGTCTNGQSLAISGTCSIIVAFTPSTNTAETATLTVSATGGITGTATLNGTGQAPPNLPAPSVLIISSSQGSKDGYTAAFLGRSSVHRRAGFTARLHHHGHSNLDSCDSENNSA